MVYALNPFTVKLDNIGSAGSLPDPVTVAHGGTGLTSYTIGDLLYASGATTLSKLSAVALGQMIVSQGTGTAPIWSNQASLIGDYGLGTSVDVLTVTATSSGVASSRRGILVSVAGGTTNNDAIVVNGGDIAISPLTASRPLKLSSSKRVVSTQIDLTSTNDISGALLLANGGTALSTVASGSILAANSLDALTAITSTSGLKVLQNSAGTVSWAIVTGSGSPVYGTSPTFTTDLTTPLIYGGSGASGDLTLQSTSNSTRGNITTPDLLVVGSASKTFAATTPTYINLATGNCSITTGAFTGVRFSPTVTCSGNSTTTLAALFNTQAVITDDGTGRTVGPALIFAGQFTYTATVAAGLAVADLAGIPGYAGLYFALTLNRTGAGTGTMTTAAGVYISALANLGVGWTVTNYCGMLIDLPTVGGTMTNFYGIKNNGAAGATRWFLYETGGMQSSHKGNLRIGSNTAPNTPLDVTGVIRTDQTAANAAVATVLGSVGPTGANTTVQEWFKININGTTRFVPCF